MQTTKQPEPVTPLIASAVPAVMALEYLAFTLGQEEYGVDIQKVQELRGYDTVTRIANAPEHIKGVVNLRGIIVPIIAMRIKFKLGAPTYDQFTVVIILNIASRVMGMVVDSVSDVITLSPEQQVAAFAKAPLQWQPGSTWEYSLSTDLLGRVLEVVGKKPLGVLLHERLIKPLGMKDTAFVVPANQVHRIAQPLAIDPLTQKPMAPMLDLTQVQGNDAGGAGLVTTAADYLRFCQMLLNNGTLDGRRYISRTTLALMTSDHLGPKVATPLQPGELLMGVQGYTFGLGFMVRQGPGLASVPGSEGDYAWAGAGGTFFWIDPKEQVIGLLMAQTPGPIRQYYRRMIKQLVYQALE
jgi:CubicO group peptidase (beta-lactamase class C family)